MLAERSDVHRLSAVTAAFEVVPTLAFTLPAMAKGPSPERAHAPRSQNHSGSLERPQHPRSPPALRPRAPSLAYKPGSKTGVIRSNAVATFSLLPADIRPPDVSGTVQPCAL